MLLNETQYLSIEQIMLIKKSIPVYQRDFVWEEVLIKSYVENLFESYESGTKSYFTGSMVLYLTGNDEVYEIVDGQQRITVIYTLISEIFRIFDNDEKVKENATIERNKYIFNKFGMSDKTYLFTHKNPDIKNCLEIIGEGKEIPESISDNVLLTNLKNCKEIVDDFLSEKFKSKKVEALFDFYEFILNKLKVTHFLAKDMSEALLIYSRLNSGGKPLGHLEIIKGQLFSQLDINHQKSWESLDNQWNEFWVKLKEPIKIGGYGQPKSLINEESFISYFFFINYPLLVNSTLKKSDGWLPTNNITDFLLNKEVKEKVFKKPEKLLKELLKFTKTLINLRTGNYPDDYCQNRITDVALLSQTQTQPLLFLLTCYENKDVFSEAVEIAFQLVFIFTTSLTGSGTTSGAWRKISQETQELQSQYSNNIDIINNLKEIAAKTIKDFWNNTFKIFLPTLNIEDNKRKAKQLLIIVEMASRQTSGIKNKIFFNEYYFQKGFDVDHLCPKNSSNISGEFIHRIGNGAILDLSDNRSLKDTPFEDPKKIKALNNSDNLTTKSLVSNPDDAQGPAQRKALSLFSKIEYLNEESILKRENEILSLIETYFGIN